jgi:hypothetical protein
MIFTLFYSGRGLIYTLFSVSNFERIVHVRFRDSSVSIRPEPKHAYVSVPYRSKNSLSSDIIWSPNSNPLVLISIYHFITGCLFHLKHNHSSTSIQFSIHLFRSFYVCFSNETSPSTVDRTAANQSPCKLLYRLLTKPSLQGGNSGLQGLHGVPRSPAESHEVPGVLGVLGVPEIQQEK